MNNDMNNTIWIDGVEYADITVQVYDRVGHRMDKRYSTLQTSFGQVWMMWRGLNVDGVRYTKTLVGHKADGTKTRIAFVG